MGTNDSDPRAVSGARRGTVVVDIAEDFHEALGAWFPRLGEVFRKRPREEELSAEIASHLRLRDPAIALRHE
jgi:hypothetical protein